MEIKEEKEHLIEIVKEQRLKTLPAIITDGKVFAAICDREHRLMIYNKVNALFGARPLQDKTIKRMYLYATHPKLGIPEKNLEATANVLRFALEEVMVIALVEMRSSHKAMGDKISLIEKYIPEYEQDS